MYLTAHYWFDNSSKDRLKKAKIVLTNVAYPETNFWRCFSPGKYDSWMYIIKWINMFLSEWKNWKSNICVIPQGSLQFWVDPNLRLAILSLPHAPKSNQEHYIIESYPDRPCHLIRSWSSKLGTVLGGTKLTLPQPMPGTPFAMLPPAFPACAQRDNWEGWQ